MAQYANAAQLLGLALTPARFYDFTTDGYASVNMQLEAASDEISMYISSQFVLPMVSWDMLLVKLACFIAARNLYIQWGYNPVAIGDKNIEERFQYAMETLKAISRKELRLDNNPAYIDSSSGIPSSGPLVVSNAPVGFGLFCTGNFNNGGWNGGEF